MNFSKTASYSLKILSCMASNPDSSWSAAYLHKLLGIPYPYLRQVLTALSKNGFIKSIRGRSGGFTFSNEIKDITLADIIESTDGLASLDNCILGFEKCPFDNECTLHSVWESTRRDIYKALKETSLKDIVEKKLKVI